MQGAMYDMTDRMSFLRALAAYDREDRAGSRACGTRGAASRPTPRSRTSRPGAPTARHSPTPTTDDFDAFVRVAPRAGVDDRSLAVAYSTAPCLYWPSQPEQWEAPAEARPSRR